MRRTLITLAFALAACGRTPSAPTSAPPASPAPTTIGAFSGLWSGTFRTEGCDGDRHCVLIKGTPVEFGARLQQSGAQVRGVFTTAFGYAVDVAGEVRPDGTLVLSGFDPGASAKDSSMSAHLEVRLAAEGGLAGDVSFDVGALPQYEDPYSGYHRSGPVTSATRSDLQSFVSTIDGAWAGKFVVRSCQPAPLASYCYPVEDQETETLELALSGSGSSLTGELTVATEHLPVSASVTGSTITLAGEALRTVSGGQTHVRVASWRGTVDEFGRMKGSFQYEFAYPFGAPSLGESANAEIWTLTKRHVR